MRYKIEMEVRVPNEVLVSSIADVLRECLSKHTLLKVVELRVSAQVNEVTVERRRG